MSEQLINSVIQELITYTIVIPIAFIVLKLIFKKSIMFKFSFLTVFFVLFVNLSTVIGQNSGGMSTLIFTPLNILVGYLLFSYINKVLRKPLNKSISQLKDISEGNIRIEVETSKSQNEIGILTNAIAGLITKLSHVINEVNDNAEKLTISGQEFKKSAEQISIGANEQAAATEEVSTTMEEISASFDLNTSNAQKAERVSSEANISISEVAERSKITNESIKKITEEIKIIDEIAEVTDILAINASIQAANAGEQGKSFSVVASEVRKLSERTARAAGEIISLANKSIEISQKSEKAIFETLPKIKDTSNLNEAISLASIEQNNGTKQVNLAIHQLNNITQQNAASSEELANSSESLESQAIALKKSIGFFNIK